MKAYTYIILSALNLSSLIGGDYELKGSCLNQRSSNIQPCKEIKKIPIEERLHRRNQHVLNLRCTAPFAPNTTVESFETEYSFLQRELDFHLQRETKLHERLEAKEIKLTQDLADVLTYIGMTSSRVRKNENRINNILFLLQDSNNSEDYVVHLEAEHNMILESLTQGDNLLNKKRKDLMEIKSQLNSVRYELEELNMSREATESMIIEKFRDSSAKSKNNTA